MKFLRMAACGLIATLVLAACGNATAGMAFKVPPGYQSKVNMFGMEMWTNGVNPNPSMIMLITIPKKFDAAKATNDFDFDVMPNSSMKNTKLTGHEKITMCTNQAAFKATAEASRQSDSSPAPGANAKRSDENVDMVVTGWGEKTYMAMYIHPHDQAADADAQAALMTLCPAAAS